MSESGTKGLLPWNEHTTYALGLHRRMCNLIGLWPLTCGELGSKARFTMVIALQLAMKYSVIKEMTSSCISLSDAVDCVGLLCTNIAVLLKILVIRAYHKQMFYMVESAVKDWSIVIDAKSHEVMLTHAYTGRIVAIIHLSWTCSSFIVLIIFTPPTIGEFTNDYLNLSDMTTITLRNIPVGTGCSVVGMSTFFYLAFYCFRFIGVFSIANCIVLSDALFFVTVMHLCGQLELLKISLMQLGQNIEEQSIKKEIVASIQRHNHLCCHMDFLEDIFNLVIFAQLTSSLFHISIIGVRILLNIQKEDHMANVVWIVSTVNLLCQSYIYSYSGEYLTSQAKEVETAAYSCSWYNFSPSLMKYIMFVMMRTNRPFILTAGKVYTMNRNTYTSMLKTLFSLFSVLKLTMIK